MKPLFALIAITYLMTACGLHETMEATKSVPDKMDETNARIDATNDNIEKTNHSVHKQTLLVALNDMLSDDNTEFTFPAPTGMMAGAKTFGEAATPEETD